MPTNFVKGKKNEELWDKAKAIVTKEYKLTEKDGDKFFALVTGVYKKSGGEIANSNESSVLRRRLLMDALYEMRKSISLKATNEAKIGNYDVAYGLGSIVTIEKDLGYKRVKVGTSWKITAYDGGQADYTLVRVNPSTGKEYAGEPWYQGEGYIVKWVKDGKVSVKSKITEDAESIDEMSVYDWEEKLDRLDEHIYAKEEELKKFKLLITPKSTKIEDTDKAKANALKYKPQIENIVRDLNKLYDERKSHINAVQ